MLIWPTGQGHTTTKGFQPGPINPGFVHPSQVGPTPRIAPELQENTLNRNNPGQRACKAKQNVIIHDGQADDLLNNGNVEDY